jgi:hypothetical protein
VVAVGTGPGRGGGRGDAFRRGERIVGEAVCSGTRRIYYDRFFEVNAGIRLRRGMGGSWTPAAQIA